MNNVLEVNPVPIFPSTLYCMNLHNDISEFFNSIIDNVDFNTIGDNPHWVSKYNLLDEYPEIKKQFTDVSLQVLSKVAGVEKIKMTTSWLTSIKPNTTPIMHRHSNCWFSGVYYFQDSPYSGLEFKNPIERDIDLVNYGSETMPGSLMNWTLQPKKNMLVIFPSYLHHRIMKNTFNEVRHSLAFNIMPDGIIGQNDSTFVY